MKIRKIENEYITVLSLELIVIWIIALFSEILFRIGIAFILSLLMIYYTKSNIQYLYKLWEDKNDRNKNNNRNVRRRTSTTRTTDKKRKKTKKSNKKDERR